MDSLKSLLTSIIDKTDIPLIVINNKMEVVLSNLPFERLANISKSSKILFGDYFPDIENNLLNKIQFSTSFCTSDGRTLQLNVKNHLLEKNLRLLVFREINFKADSLQAQRLETLGMLAGGVAHDFNNILAGIMGHSAYLKNILPASGEHQQSLDAIEEGGRRASEMTQEILRFSKVENNSGGTPVELNNLTKRSINLLRRALSPKREIVLSSSVDELTVIGSELKISQILFNLIVNAHDALNDAEKKSSAINVGICICSDRKKLQDIFGEPALLSEYAQIKVSDDGIGMSRETLERAFEPYFSTKMDRGTGLGLATVAAIVKSLAGAINVESKLNSGTEVSIFLPFVANITVAMTAPQSKVDKAKKNKSVLIVDDEEAVRNVLALNLKQLGYQAELAASGLEAIEKIDAGNHFDLVLLDMLMPHISGEETFYELRKRVPDQKCLIISGFCSEDVLQRLLSDGAKGFLPKPFGIQDLSRKIEESLND